MHIYENYTMCIVSLKLIESTISNYFYWFTDSTKKPGPGAYSPEKVHVNKPSPPKHSLGIRHSEYVTPLIIEVRE